MNEHKLHDLSDGDIAKIVAELNIPFFHGTPTKDRLPLQPQYGWWIVNMQSHDEGDKQGTHWVFVGVLHDDQAVYFDSFGQAMPDNIHWFLRGKQLSINHDIFQDIRSELCGYFCLYVALRMFKDNVPFHTIINELRQQSPQENDTFLTTFFSQFHLF
jgi:hypothetical protein